MIQELTTRYGTMFVPNTDIGQHWWLDLSACSPEDEYIQVVCDLLDEQPRGIAVDAGANIGCWTLALAKHASGVVSFEPQRCIYEVLVRNIRANNLTNVHPRRVAVGEHTGFALVPDLDVDKATNFGGVSLGIAHHEHPGAPLKKVAMVSLDEILFRNDKISFIKIDIEGGELDALKGARGTIAKHKPLMFIEVVHSLTDTAALAKMIESYGYALDYLGLNALCIPIE
jgi:FkbM family methyltransferase